MIINKIDNGALNVIKLEGQVNKAERYMTYNHILFTESRENPMLVINEAKTGGFIICKSNDKHYAMNLIKTNFKYIGYTLSEYEGEEDSQGNVKINYEIKKTDSAAVRSEINLLNAQGDSVYRENNDDFHIFHNIRNDKNFTLVTALSNADKMRFNNRTNKFQSLVIYDQGRTGGILFTEHTRNGVVKARLKRVAEYYGMEVKIEADNEYIFSGCQTAVIRFEFIKPMPALELGIERPDATEYYRLVNDVLERIC